MDRKKAIVTGASRGIGAGIAENLAKNGYDLAISYSHKYDCGDTYAKQTMEALQEKYGCACHLFDADFKVKGAAEEFIHSAITALNGVDLLVNNGMKPELGGSILDIDPDDIEGMANSYIRSTFLMMRQTARCMVMHRIPGSIVNITSGRAERALPGGGLYGGLKACLTHASRSFALDLAPYGIRINCIAPGYIKVRTYEEYLNEGRTKKQADDMIRLEKMVPIGYPGSADDIGKAVAWIASDDAAYVTGTVLTVDGGFFLPGMPEETPNEGEEYRGWVCFKDRSSETWDI